MTSIKCQKICFTAINTKKKMFASYLELEKNCYLAILSLKNNVAAIWKEKKVDPCDLETKKYSSQLLGARKKIMTSIRSQKNSFTAIKSTKKCFPAIWNWKKQVSSYFESDKH